MNELIKRVDTITAITSRGTGQPQVFDEKKLAKIAAGMPEIHRATRVYGRKNTQTSNRLMTLTMLADASPYHVIRQCLAQIENKKNALRDSKFRYLKSCVKLDKFLHDLECEKKKDQPDEFKIRMLEIKIAERKEGLADATLYIEGALKDLASFQSSYQQICKNKGIPEKWDEEDMEKAEVEHHLRMAFLNAFRNIMATGRPNMGTLEYLQQMGVHPEKAYRQVSDYISSLNGQADYEHLECWLDKMVEENKDNYLQVLERIGIDQLYETWYQYIEVKENDDERTG